MYRRVQVAANHAQLLHADGRVAHEIVSWKRGAWWLYSLASDREQLIVQQRVNGKRVNAWLVFTEDGPLDVVLTYRDLQDMQIFA